MGNPLDLAGRGADRTLAAELLAELRATNQRSSEFMALLQGQVINNVLQVETVVFPNEDGSGNGSVSRSWSAVCGSVTVTNQSTNQDMRVVSGSSTGGAGPTQGVGVWLVRPGATTTVPIAGRQVTFHGVSGERISYAAYTAGPRPVT